MSPNAVSPKRSEKDIVANLNFFINVPVAADWAMAIVDGLSKPGDYVDVRTEMDVAAIIPNSPQTRNPCNADPVDRDGSSLTAGLELSRYSGSPKVRSSVPSALQRATVRRRCPSTSLDPPRRIRPSGWSTGAPGRKLRPTLTVATPARPKLGSGRQSGRYRARRASEARRILPSGCRTMEFADAIGMIPGS